MDTKPCPNCSTEISLANYELHEAFCSRNLKKCDCCDTLVLRKLWDDHVASEHSFVECDQCKRSMEKFRLPDHKFSCPNRLVKCEFCNIEVPAHDAQDHADRCGSRTELCAICDKYVMIRDLKLHEISHEDPDPESTSADRTSVDLDTDFNLALELQCVELGQQTEVQPDEFQYPSNDFDEIAVVEAQVPCEFCHQLYNLSEIMEHQCGCELNVPPELSRVPFKPDSESADLIGRNSRRTTNRMTSSHSSHSNVSSPDCPIHKKDSTSERQVHRANPQYILPPLEDPILRSRAAVARTSESHRVATRQHGKGSSSSSKRSVDYTASTSNQSEILRHQRRPVTERAGKILSQGKSISGAHHRMFE